MKSCENSLRVSPAGDLVWQAGNSLTAVRPLPVAPPQRYQSGNVGVFGICFPELPIARLWHVSDKPLDSA